MKHRKSSNFCGWAVILALGLLGTIVGCVVNPYTQRHQLILLPESYDRGLGAEAYQQVVRDPKVRISRDPREIEPVQRVANRIIEAAKQSKYGKTAREFEWEVTVIKDDKTANAFALPGGKVAVYTGLFPMARNEAGLAAVLGHEVIHALARHGAERMSQNIAAELLLTGVGVGLQSQSRDPETTKGIMQALGLGAQVGVLLPFSREHESEADHVGLLLAAQAGYDPRESIALWERMERTGGRTPPEFLSTHPSHGTRISQLKKWMPEALAAYEKSAQMTPVKDLPSL